MSIRIITSNKVREGVNERVKRVNRTKAFTLVETLVAISILVIALTGPLAIIASSLKSSYFSRDEITAAYLAQEPIEYIRNLRDQNALRSINSLTWLSGITTDASNNNFLNNAGPLNQNSIKLNLIWQTNKYALQDCTQPLVCSVSYDADAGSSGDLNKVAYGATGAPDQSIYTRDIYLSAVASDPTSQREILITVVVSWNTGGISHNVTVTEHLFNWQLEDQS